MHYKLWQTAKYACCVWGDEGVERFLGAVAESWAFEVEGDGGCALGVRPAGVCV